MGRSLALVCLSAVAGLACASPRSYRRTLLVDQLPPYAPRGEVFKTLKNTGWCPEIGVPGVEMWKRCLPEDETEEDEGADADPFSARQHLALMFYEGKLVHAVFITPFRRVFPRPRQKPAGTDFVSPANDTTRENTAVSGKRAEIHEPIPVVSTSATGVPVDRKNLEERLFSALSAELSRRYGPPEGGFTDMGIRGVWMKSGTWRLSEGEVQLLVTRGMVVETWAFAPWEIDRIPTPLELKGGARRVGRRGRVPVSVRSGPGNYRAYKDRLSPDPGAAAADLHREMAEARRAARERPCRRPGVEHEKDPHKGYRPRPRPPEPCPRGWFCVKSDQKQICLPGEDFEDGALSGRKTRRVREGEPRPKPQPAPQSQPAPAP